MRWHDYILCLHVIKHVFLTERWRSKSGWKWSRVHKTRISGPTRFKFTQLASRKSWRLRCSSTATALARGLNLRSVNNYHVWFNIITSFSYFVDLKQIELKILTLSRWSYKGRSINKFQNRVILSVLEVWTIRNIYFYTEFYQWKNTDCLR